MAQQVESIISKIEVPLTAENIGSIALNILSLLINMQDVAQTDYAKMTTDALSELIAKQSLSAEDKMNLNTLVSLTVPQVVRGITETVEAVESSGFWCCSCHGKKKKKAAATNMEKDSVKPNHATN